MGGDIMTIWSIVIVGTAICAAGCFVGRFIRVGGGDDR